MSLPATVLPVVLLSMLASIGHRGSKVLVSLAALRLGAGPFEVGLLAALYAVFPLLLAVYAGRVSDRLGMRGPIALGALGMAGALLVPLAAPASLALLFVCPALVGLGQIFLHVSIHNAVGGIGGAQNRARNFSVFSLGASIATFLGPSLTGVSIDTLGYGPSFVALSAFMLAAALVALAFPGIFPPRPGPGEEPAARGGFALLASSPLRRTLLMSGVTLTGIELFSFYFPVYGKSIGLSATSIGFVMSAYAAAAFVVRLGMHRLARRYTEIGVLTASLFVASLTYWFLPLADRALVLALLAFLLGLGLGSAQPLTIMLTYNHAPPGRSGEALGMRLTVNKVTQIAVPLVFGSLGTAFGLLPVFWANAAFLLAGGVVSLGARPAAADRRRRAD